MKTALLTAALIVLTLPPYARAEPLAEPDRIGSRAMDPFVDVTGRELNRFWAWPFEALQPKRTFSPPGLTWVNEEGGTDTACGLFELDEGLANGSFYCDRDQIVYLEYSRLRQNDADWGIPGVFSTMAHEWGHHVQWQLGLLDTLSKRQLELQADCMAGAFMHWVQKGNDQTGPLNTYADLGTLMRRFYAIGDPPPPAGYVWSHPHGSPAERQSAFARGWELTVTPYTCTTWRP